MFNGYNETPLISYEFNQERVEKKQENAGKWSYGHEPGLQPPQNHPNNRHPDFWPPKPGFVGLSNVVKCTCTGCYPTSENQSYQGDNTRHRPWLPRTFPVPLNGSNDPCKLPPYQWDNGSLSQGSCYPEANVPFVQETGGKHGFYRHYPESRLPDPNQAGVIASLKKQTKEETGLQNDMRQPVFCNPIYNLAKRADGRNYCDPSEKYSNAATFPPDQHIPRLPVIEPYLKAVPSNLSENRVPSAGYRSVKENMCQPYLEAGGYGGESRKASGEVEFLGEKRSEGFPTGTLSSGAHVDYSHYGRDVPEGESQKLFFDSGRHSEYYSRKSFENAMNRNNQSLEKKKDCAMSQLAGEMSVGEQYGVPRSKYPDPGKPSCEAFYPKDLDKVRPENHPVESSACFHRNEDKSENMNVHARLARSALIFNEPRFTEKTQNSFPYQNNPALRNYARPEYPYQGYDSQHRYDYPPAFQRNDFHYCRPTPQQTLTSDHFIPPQQPNPYTYDPQSFQNSDKTNLPPSLPNSLPPDPKNPSLLNPIRTEPTNKNGTTKISPLRLLRKKKFINVPHEPSPMTSTLDAAPGLDVRKFWSTWAEEEEENVAPTQMVVLDCQNIDLEQAKLLHLYDTDPVRGVQLESGNVVLKDSGKETGETAAAPVEEIPKAEETTAAQRKEEPQEVAGERNPKVWTEEGRAVEPVAPSTSPSKCKIGKTGAEKERGGKKCEGMDKWTEKKFDFLKRSEESKAAEMLRHEEEKKKILETRLSLQQSLKKAEKRGGGKHGVDKTGESLSNYDENSQSSSADGGSGDVTELPTSEYRRNKFLDYSERKVIMNGGSEKEEGETGVGTAEAEEVKEENVKIEKADADSKKKEPEPGLEIEGILEKMSEINFKNRDVILENGTKDAVAKKWKTSSKKLKKKKSDQQLESEQRPQDKLTLETVKFSIQKSHDLKISFKVLNNSKKSSDEEEEEEEEEEGGSKLAEVQGNATEDSKNSTELITLSYKSIQRDGDRRSGPESKKTKRRFRRKKNNHPSGEKTPVLKIKKSRYMPESERDPLANDDDSPHLQDNPYPDDHPAPDDFHVHETVDSAKIKLTFKRHKPDFETHYRINNNTVADLSELEAAGEDLENRGRKKSRRAKEDVLAGGAEAFEEAAEVSRDEDESVDATEAPDVRKSGFEDEEQEEEEEVPCGGFGGFEEGAAAFGVEDSKQCEDPDRSGGEKREVSEEEGKRFSILGWGEEKWEESGSRVEGSSSEERKEGKEEIGEISLDLISSTNSEIETNHKAGKTEEREAGRREGKGGGINGPEIEGRFHERKSEDGGEEGANVTENLWEKRRAEKGDASDVPIGDPEREASGSSPLACRETENVEISTRDDRGIETAEEDSDGAGEEKANVGRDEQPSNGMEAVENLVEGRSSAELPSGKDLVGAVGANGGESDKESNGEFEATDEIQFEVSFEEKSSDAVTQVGGSSEAKSLRPSSPPRETHCEIPEITFEDVPFPSLESPKCENAGKRDFSPAETPQDSGEVATDGGNDSEMNEATEALVDVPSGQTPVKDPEETCFSPECGEPCEKDEEGEAEGRDDPAGGFAPKNLPSDVELEEGEIVDSSDDDDDDSDEKPEKDKNSDEKQVRRNIFEFVKRKPERRNSGEGEVSGVQAGFGGRCSRKAKSCPPEVKFREEGSSKGLGVVVEEIPLPLGPAPERSCFDLKKRMRLTEEEPGEVEAKEKPKGSISPRGVEVKQKEAESESPSGEPSLGTSDPEKDKNPSPSTPEAPPLSAIFQRSSKIKFSFTRRSRFSKIGFNSTMEKSPETLFQKSVEEAGKGKLDPDEKEENKLPERGPKDEDVTMPEDEKADKLEGSAEGTETGAREEEAKGEREGLEQSKELAEERKSLVGEDLEENIEVVGGMSEYMRDEFYECEDIPTSEDLTNGDDLEIEKVNDDKFRNIMQNCLDNAKKFLNVGNLKLFSCSVDDLLELDCQALDSALEEQEARLNHISRDVLLASCDDTNDELALSDNVQPSDLSMDFVSSFSSDVCPEILPVDNWPYLEEEVPSSPTKPKQDDSDLIPPLETAPSDATPDVHRQFHSEMDGRKRVLGDGCFKHFRRRSLLADGEAIRMCSKVGAPRRNTVDGFGGTACGKTELMRWKSGKAETEEGTLKCRVSLEKLGSKHGADFELKREGKPDDSAKHENGMRKKNGKSFDYKSPSWQPKVMLFRISKNELRKLRRHKSKLEKRSEMSSARREILNDLEDNPVAPATKKCSKPEAEKVYVKLERGCEEGKGSPNEERMAGLPGLESIKGSLSVMPPSNERKRKKCRFRNLHKKRKPDPDSEKDVLASAHRSPSTEPMLVDAETALTEMFRDCDLDSNSRAKSTKEVIYSKNPEKPKKKSSETPPAAEKTEETARSHEYPGDQHKQREKTKKKEGSHKDRRRDKDEQYKHGERHREGDKGRSGDASSHGRSGWKDVDESRGKGRERFRSGSGGEGKWKGQRESSWCCEVCGFSDAEERTSHIKSHPFHCQSCHLAFKTEVHFVSHLTKRHKDIRNQHHCLLCELSFNTEEQYHGHLETREHRHLEAVEKNTINTLFTLLTGAPCPVLGLVETKPDWLPNQPGTVHFYHQATPLSLALQYLKMHHNLTSLSTVSSAHPK